MAPVRLDPTNRLDLLVGARSVGLDDVPYPEVSRHFFFWAFSSVKNLRTLAMRATLRFAAAAAQSGEYPFNIGSRYDFHKSVWWDLQTIGVSSYNMQCREARRDGRVRFRARVTQGTASIRCMPSTPVPLEGIGHRLTQCVFWQSKLAVPRTSTTIAPEHGCRRSSQRLSCR